MKFFVIAGSLVIVLGWGEVAFAQQKVADPGQSPGAPIAPARRCPVAGPQEMPMKPVSENPDAAGPAAWAHDAACSQILSSPRESNGLEMTSGPPGLDRRGALTPRGVLWVASFGA